MQAHPSSRPAARNFTQVRASARVAEGLGLAHDAGNLLGALGLYCDLLSAPGVLRPEHRHYARELRLLAERSGTLIQRLLECESAAPEKSSEGHRPAEVARALLPLLESIAMPMKVTLAADSASPTLFFPADVLERILVNLTRNAAVALAGSRARESRRGHIRITVSRIASGTNAGVQLTVADNGPGMLPAIAASFLRPLPLLPGATSGLGHRVVHDLVEATGGILSINVKPHQGTTMHIDWPSPRLLVVKQAPAAAAVETSVQGEDRGLPC